MFFSLEKKQVLHAEVMYLHLLLYFRLSPALHYLYHRRHLESIMHKGQGAIRCFIWAPTLPGKEEWENYAAFRRAICHHPFLLFFLVGLLCCLFLFICVFFCSPVLKGDESILYFSVWEKFQQQTFYSLPSSWELRGAQLFLLRGRQGEASGNASSLSVWLLVEMGKMWKDKWLCSLQTRGSTKKTF